MKGARRIGLMVIFLGISLLLISCGLFKKDEDEMEVPGTQLDKVVEILSQDEQDSIMKNFYQMLVNKDNREDIVTYIDENIKGLDKENGEAMITGLEDFLSSTDSSMNEDYALLSKYTDYVSEEMKSYIMILEKETGSSFTDGEVLNVDISEILNRGLDAEKHIDKFPKGKTSKKIFELYTEYINASILGMGNQYIFAEEGSSKIRYEYLQTYESFIKANMDTKTSHILTQYIEVLKRSQGDLNSEDVNRFYDELELTIGEKF